MPVAPAPVPGALAAAGGLPARLGAARGGAAFRPGPRGGLHGASAVVSLAFLGASGREASLLLPDRGRQLFSVCAAAPRAVSGGGVLGLSLSCPSLAMAVRGKGVVVSLGVFLSPCLFRVSLSEMR